MKNIENLEAIRDYLDKLIDDADKYIAKLDKEIIENEKLIVDCINARELLKHLESKEDN